jgi:hypothetical protein
MEKEFKIGKYQHFKGKFYQLIGIAKNSENPNEEFVVYKALYDNNELWIRPKQMFGETVLVDGKEVERFKFIEEP